jgi:hypothetical protein
MYWVTWHQGKISRPVVMCCWLRLEHWHGAQRTDEGKSVCNILSSCSGVDNSSVLGYDYMLIGVLFPTFQASLLPPFSAIQEALK